MSKVSPPDFTLHGSTGGVHSPRSAHAAAWNMIFWPGLFGVWFLADGPSRFGRVPVIAVWGLGIVVCQLIAISDRVWPRHRWSKILLVCCSAVLPVWLIYFTSHGLGLSGGAPTPADIEAFLSEKTSTETVVAWEEDAQSWSALVQAMPAGAERERLVEAFATTLTPLLEEGRFVIHATLAAATDAGVMRGEVARAMLTRPSRRATRPIGTAEEEARAWLADASRHDLTDDYQYACAAAVSDVLPQSPELQAIVVAALRAGDGPLVQDDALRGLTHLARMADRVGVSTDVPELRARVHATLRLLHRDEFGGSWAWPIGFLSDPDGPGSKLVDPQATHSALELMDRFGVPDDVDLSRLRLACEYRSSSFFYGFSSHGASSDHVISLVDVDYLGTRWPAESAPRWQLLDGLGALALLLIVLAVLDIRRQPPDDPEPSRATLMPLASAS